MPVPSEFYRSEFVPIVQAEKCGNYLVENGKVENIVQFPR